MAKLKILIVEDEVLIALPLKAGLNRAGYDVYGPVASGEEAIASTQKENPDVILMDIRLIGSMDGIEAAQHIGAFSPAKVIFTTGYQESRLKDRALAIKPLAYLIKPIEVHAIRSILQGIQAA